MPTEKEWVTDEQIAALTEGNTPREVSREVGKEVSTEVAKARYPWATWLDGEYHVIMRGREFVISKERMRMQILNRAKLEGLVAWTESLEGDLLGFQFFPSQNAKDAAQIRAREEVPWEEA